jgi:hypothetical protein
MGKRKFKPRYIGKKISKLPYISDIFQSDKNEYYTKDALMYQDIIRFSDDKSSFSRTELYNWLLRHNQELIDYYKDLSTRNIPYSARVANKKDRLDRIFNNLLDMKVIVRSGTTSAKKLKKMDIETYSIDKSGKLILEVIRNMSLKNELLAAQRRGDSSLIQIRTNELENNHLNIYNLITSMFIINDEIPYQSIVLKEFIVNLQNRKLFSKFVDYVTSVVHISPIRDTRDLVSVVLNFMLNRAPERDLFIDLFYESSNGLGSEGREIFLYQRKLDIEKNVRNNPNGYSKEYEKQCFATRADYNNIVLELECNECKKCSTIILDHDKHKSLIRDIGSFGLRHGNIQKFDCKHCQSQNSCSLLTF